MVNVWKWNKLEMEQKEKERFIQTNGEIHR